MIVRGVIWDLDGVLVDTAETHYISWHETLPAYGIQITYDLFRKSFGMNNEGVLTFLIGHKPDPDLLAEVDDRKESAFRQAIRGHARLLPGVLDWLEKLQKFGVRMAVGSSAPMANVDALVDETGIRRFFVTLISANGKPSKPDPWVFLQAAKQIDVAPETCWVVEDAVSGVEAAHRAGMRCLAVTTTNSAKALSAAEIVLDRLDQSSLEVLWTTERNR
jgi:HAD superfamily hydrolase (TIGR01509 family)